MTRSASERAHILATDDRPETLRLVERSLEGEYECKSATCVDMALEMLDRQRFQLALCGVQRSEESGLVLAEEIFRDHPDTAIVMMTGVDDPNVAEQAFRFGAQGYLMKPFCSGQLLVTVANALRQRQLELAERRRHTALLGSVEEQAEALRHDLIEAQRRAIEDLQASRQETAERLARAVEMHDPDAGRHLSEMASIAALLGAKLGLDPDHVLLLRAATPLHDIGKIAAPDGVLYKRGELTLSERKWMESHTTAGYRILASSESGLLRLAATIALTHHEWFNGSGYPRGLSGTEIPVEGRIVAVADALDALLSDHPYRPALTVEEATGLIAEGSGTHFDPNVVDALFDNLGEALALRGRPVQ
jgi:putative two-component system response regulator